MTDLTLEQRLEVARAEARAEAFSDAAYIVRNAYKHGGKAETPEEWLQMSYTFSNQAYLIRRQYGLKPSPEKLEA